MVYNAAHNVFLKTLTLGTTFPHVPLWNDGGTYTAPKHSGGSRHFEKGLNTMHQCSWSSFLANTHNELYAFYTG